MREALDCFVIEGVQTNISFLSTVLENKKFEAGNFSTSFIAEEFPTGFDYLTSDLDLSKKLGIVAICLDEFQSSRMIRSLTPHLKITRQKIDRIAVVSNASFQFSFKLVGRDTFIFHDGVGQELKVEIDWRPGDPLLSASIGDPQLKIKIKLEKGSFII